MAYNYIDTPRTQVGNATYLNTGFRSTTRHNLSALDSLENSFHSPSEDRDLLKSGENKRSRKSDDFSLRTPRAGPAPRSAKGGMQSRRNLPTAAIPRGEFTPLMKSVTKNNFLRNTGKGGPETPAFLRNDYRDPNTPGLPRIEASEIYEDRSMNSINENDATPIPEVASSSPQSTPLPVLPSRNGGGGVLGDDNMMTLREQESAIDKLNKDNFDLKLKVHFLEEKLNKLGPDVNRIALQENIELKVSGKTMERELYRCKKSLARAQTKAESCQRELEEFQEMWKRKQGDDAPQKELNWMKEEMETKDIEINELREDLKAAQEKQSDELQELRGQISDLEYTIREKDRLLDEKEDELEDLKEKELEEHSSLAELEAELERARNQIQELKGSIERMKGESQNAEAAYQKANEERDRAVDDLRELQDEMANKSFYSKGLNRQLEEKAHALEDEVTTLRQQCNDAQEELESKRKAERQLGQQVHDLRQELVLEKGRYEDRINLLERERDVARKERDSASSQLCEIEDELRSRGDDKNLLQNRHDALTHESQELQRDLERARDNIADLEQQISDEKQRYFEAIEDLRLRHRDEIDLLQDDIESLKRKLEDSEAQFNVDRDKWESVKRTLDLQKHQAEQQASGYKRTVERLQQTESSLSGKEKRLQDAIDSEKQLHLQEKELLNCQIKDLTDDIASRRQTIESQRTELLSLKEELRVAKREGEMMEEKIRNLEDEAIILKASLEQEMQFGEDKRRNGVSELEKQLQNSLREKQTLRDQVAKAEAELSELRAALPDIEADRDELKSQLNRFHNQVDETYRFDQEKLDLRKAKLRFEADIKRLKEENRVLVEAKKTLKNELDIEVERAAGEENRLLAALDQLQDKLFTTSEQRNRELAVANNKATRLENRVKDLEAILEQQGAAEVDIPPISSDSSILRHRLDESRKKERAALQREADLKSSVRHLKACIADLEMENHELQTQQFDPISSSAGISPTSKFLEENRKLRGQVLEAHKKMKELRTKNHELQRHAMMGEERKELHELLKSATLEAESLSVKLSERDARVNELRNHLRRVREERSLSRKRADTANNQLQVLQDKYELALDDMASRVERKGRHEKELRGLSKEILWLRARLSREERFRKDLAWSKGIMELGERVRIACNEMDLKMIAEMGVEPSVAATKLSARKKFKSAVLVVMAATRMQKLATEWRKARKIGEGLRRAKAELLKRRELAQKASAPSLIQA
ncbi:spindle-pole body protein [Coccidioides immitis RS]|uniref:Spindle-pole body protein n=2 Tax=Coccidioides immitis TaxID=5501 RepID=J3KK63_COCIM|nr:spindle-pole body protein [Coccidioides immitis RS]EAS36536.3 spindle-pole body protein [Coccidioides immitis RS]KMP01897.1 Hypothetical Protein CIRG_02036 [Coccidioides immitis RMSCC 2394]